MERIDVTDKNKDNRQNGQQIIDECIEQTKQTELDECTNLTEFTKWQNCFILNENKFLIES